MGGAGHSSEILKRLHGGTLVGIDRDQDAIQAAMARLESLNADARFMALHGNFHDAKALLAGAGIARVDGILVDLGVSSHQLDVRERGFSYHDDAPLDMRMDVSQPLNACVIVNTYSEDGLTRIIRDYGEENWARQIARVICDRRKNAPIERTSQLVEIIDAAIPKKFRAKDGSHPARRTFQALRIAVNDELDPLEPALSDLVALLNPGGRLCVITFHSLEDRIVKNAFRRRGRIRARARNRFRFACAGKSRALNWLRANRSRQARKSLRRIRAREARACALPKSWRKP